MVRALYPGSFDPFTNGHLSVLEKAIKRYVKVIKAADTENIPEDTITYRIVGLFESALMDRLKGD